MQCFPSTDDHYVRLQRALHSRLIGTDDGALAAHQRRGRRRVRLLCTLPTLRDEPARRPHLGGARKAGAWQSCRNARAAAPTRCNADPKATLDAHTTAIFKMQRVLFKRQMDQAAMFERQIASCYIQSFWRRYESRERIRKRLEREAARTVANAAVSFLDRRARARAATSIAARYRGCMRRSARAHELHMMQLSSVAQKAARGFLSRRSAIKLRAARELTTQCVLTFVLYASARTLQSKIVPHVAAQAVQCFFRKQVRRKRAERLRERQAAARERVAKQRRMSMRLLFPARGAEDAQRTQPLHDSNISTASEAANSGSPMWRCSDEAPCAGMVGARKYLQHLIPVLVRMKRAQESLMAQERDRCGAAKGSSALRDVGNAAVGTGDGVDAYRTWAATNPPRPPAGAQPSSSKSKNNGARKLKAAKIGFGSSAARTSFTAADRAEGGGGGAPAGGGGRSSRSSFDRAAATTRSSFDRAERSPSRSSFDLDVSDWRRRSSRSSFDRGSGDSRRLSFRTSFDRTVNSGGNARAERSDGATAVVDDDAVTRVARGFIPASFPFIEPAPAPSPAPSNVEPPAADADSKASEEDYGSDFEDESDG